MPDPMFVLEDVRFAYRAEEDVLCGVSLSIPRGEYVALLGANGSGKSTLARHLNGLLTPREGSVRTAGYDTRDPENMLAIRSRVGMVFQTPDNQIVATTVEDDVAFGLENLGVAPDEIERRVSWALEATGLLEVRQRPPHLLSGGQKQRLAIASALAMSQEAIILDEATSSLDSLGRKDLLSLVEDLHRERGVTVLTVTHRMEEVLDADRVFVLSAGRLVLQGTPREIFSQANALRELNLEVPDVAKVAGRLNASRPTISADCLTPGELLDGLRKEIGRQRSLRSLEPAAPSAVRAPAEEDALVVVSDLQHTYLRGTPLEHVALHQANLLVGPGEAVAIVGATGSGKSTLMQHLNGIMRPQSGRVVSAGVDLTRGDADVATLRQRVGLLFQSPEDQLFEQLVGDDVAYGPFQAKWPLDRVRDNARWAMELVGLDFDAFKDRPIFALSGGERRKVALAGVLALRPHVLVLDEPTAGLDPATAQSLLEALRRLVAEGVSVVFVTHNLDEVLALADRISIMAGGRTLATFPTEEVIARPEVLEEHGFTVPPLLELVRGARALGLGDLAARRPDEASRQILEGLHALEGPGDMSARGAQG